MISCLILGLLVNNQSPKVSLELRGVRLENAAAKIAQSLGIQELKIGPSLLNEVLVIRCTDVEPSTLKEKIAKALNAEWEERSDGWHLAQSEKQRMAELKIDSDERQEIFAKLVRKAQTKLAKLPTFDNNLCQKLQKDIEALAKLPPNDTNVDFWLKTEKIDSQSPLERLSLRMVSQVTPDMIAQLSPDYSRIVYCTNPTNMQVAFPFAVRDILAGAIQEQTIWANFGTGEVVTLKGTSRRGDAVATGEGEEGDTESNTLGSLNGNRKPYKPGDFFTVTMALNLSTESIDITAYDKDGHQTISSNFSGVDEDYIASFDSAKPIPNQSPTVVTFQGEAKEFRDSFVMGYRNRGRTRVTPSQALQAKALQPEIFDPLSFTAPEVVFASAKRPNIVAVVGDEFITASQSNMLSRMATPESVGIEEFDRNWQTFRYKNPLSEKRSRVDRKVLGNLLRFITKNNRDLTLDELSKVATSVPDGQLYNYLLNGYLYAFTGTPILSSNMIEPLRIYGSMSEDIRKRATQSGVSLGQTSEALQRIMFHSLFCSERNFDPEIASPEEPTEQQQKDLEKLEQLVYGGIFGDPTFSMPNGLRNNYFVKMSEDKEKMIAVQSVPLKTTSGSNPLQGIYTSIDASSLGAMMFMQTKPEVFGGNRQMTKLDTTSIKLKTVHNVTIRLEIGNGMAYLWHLQNQTNDDAKIYTLDTLPKEIRDEIAEGYKEAEENFKQNGPPVQGPTGSGINRNPPPPKR